MSNLKAIITGITGQDGAYLTKFLLEKGYQVFGVISGDPERDTFTNFEKVGLSDSQITKILFDDLESIADDGFEIYNLVGQSSVGFSWAEPVITFEINLNRYVKLLQIFKGKKVKVMQASSGEMYGDNNGEALKEDRIMTPDNPYSLSKFAAHRYGQIMRDANGMWITNTIFFNHESPLRDSKFVTRKILDAAKAISEGSADVLELGNIEVERDWGFAEDYVKVMWQVLQQEKPMDINIATGTTISLKTFVKYAFEHYGINDFEKYIKVNPEFIRATDIKTLKADVSKLKSLGIELEPVSAKNIGRLI